MSVISFFIQGLSGIVNLVPFEITESLIIHFTLQGEREGDGDEFE